MLRADYSARMTHEPTETCPGCGAVLPLSTGPIHRYIGASASCWERYAMLNGGGHPAIFLDPFNSLLVDAYAAQHVGTPSDQSIQSVAVHLLTLYGVILEGVAPDQALWLRQRALRPGRPEKHARFAWLTPPDFGGGPRVIDVEAAEPLQRAAACRAYIQQVWSAWSRTPHLPTLAAWYATYISAERIGLEGKQA